MFTILSPQKYEIDQKPSKFYSLYCTSLIIYTIEVTAKIIWTCSWPKLLCVNYYHVLAHCCTVTYLFPHHYHWYHCLHSLDVGIMAVVWYCWNVGETVTADSQTLTVWDSQKEAALQYAVAIFHRLSVPFKSPVQFLCLSPLLWILRGLYILRKNYSGWIKFGRNWSLFIPGRGGGHPRTLYLFVRICFFQSHAISNHHSFSVRFIGAYQPFAQLQIQFT